MSALIEELFRVNCIKISPLQLKKCQNTDKTEKAQTLSLKLIIRNITFVAKYLIVRQLMV